MLRNNARSRRFKLGSLRQKGGASPQIFVPISAASAGSSRPQCHEQRERTMRLKWLAAIAALAFAAQAQAQEVNPAVVYDLGGKFDKSFNEAAYRGAERFKEETGIEYRDFEIQNDSQREQALRRFAQAGHNPVVAVGFSMEAALKEVAAEFPETQFAIIDMVVEL